MSSNIISSLGAGSGIDVPKLVSGLVEAEKAPQQNRIDTSKEKLDTQISAYGALKSSLSEFQGLLSPLSNPDIFQARSVSFPETSLITPNSLGANAQTGAFQIEVLALAQAHSVASGAVADPAADLGGGTVSIRFGEWASYDAVTGPAGFTLNAEKASLDITLAAGESLNDLAKKINESDSGVHASIFTSDGQSQLLLTSPSGAQQAMEVSGDMALLQFNSTDHSMSQTLAGQDASIKVNGLSVTRESNDIDDVIQGLSFTLNQSKVGETVNFSISQDKGTAEQAIRDFVEGYNALYETMKNFTGVRKEENEDGEEENFSGVLSRDSTAKALLSRIRETITSAVDGLDPTGFSSLTTVGIRTALDGKLEIDEEEFKSALSSKFDELGALFSTQKTSTNSSISVGFGSAISNAKAATYDVVVSAEPSQGQVESDLVTLLDTTSGGPYSFKINVDGTESGEITLPSKIFASEEELAAELQVLINSDSQLKAVGSALSVTYDSGTDKFTFTSRQYGRDSEVQFTEATNTGSLGISTGLVGTSGTDVAGTINGKAADGFGNVLLPQIGTDAYGLSLTVGSGSLGSSQVSFTRGIAGELSLLLDSFLNTSSGTIKERESSLNKQLDGLDVDQEDLDRRMNKYELRLMNQFMVMERILAGFSKASGELDGLVDRLPFTADR